MISLKNLNNHCLLRWENSRKLSFSITKLFERNHKFPFAQCSLNTNKLSINNSSLKSYLHSSAILKSDQLNLLPEPVNIEPSSSSEVMSPVNLDASSSSINSPSVLEAVSRLRNERLASLQLIKYQEKPEEAEEER